jgi:hypothetical protein
MMQKSIQRYLIKTHFVEKHGAEKSYEVIADYWRAVSKVFNKEWNDQRHYLLTKGIGLYALMNLLSDYVLEKKVGLLTEDYFIKNLRILSKSVDWSTSGMFAGVGGQKGANKVYLKLKGDFDASIAS